MKNIRGLNSLEVNERISKGLINTRPALPARTVGQIIRSNVFTLFNGLNLVLASLVLLAGSPKNALFAGVILTNTAMGIFQELKAKSTIEKLSLLNQNSVEVLRDGDLVSIPGEEIVLDDVVALSPGDQIAADGILLSEELLEVDESSLTGESDPVLKSSGAQILSGSFVVSGGGLLKITDVGEKTYISKLSDEAKKFKKINSELRSSIDRIVKGIIWILLPLGSLLMASQILFSDKSWNEAVLSSIAGIVGMVPEGLVLLTTVSFLVGVIRLSKWNTLVQELPATEVLARVDTICLDKTGTLTEGNLVLSDIIFTDKTKSSSCIEREIAATVHAFASSNPTKKAIVSRFPVDPGLSVSEKVPFSSEKKWSAVRLSDGKVLALGAPEVLADNLDAYGADSLASSGKRVLLFAVGSGSTVEAAFKSGLSPAAILVLEDRVRSDAPETLAYFKDQGVEVKIISGDNPVTVSAIASEAGVEHAERYIDARTLPEDVSELVPFLEEYTVFGRVTPHQKRDLVKALKSTGKTVAMTGDGVNDILALKESDCGIALASGSEATKSVAQLVLLDSNFSSLPKVVSEGRRIVNNLERVAALYLTKTIYSIALALIFSLTTLPYPFIPIHLTLMGSLAIGIPSFFLALSPNDRKVSRGFLYRVLSTTVPKGITVALSTFLMFAIAHFSGLDLDSTRTLSVLISGGISLVVLLKVARPLTVPKLLLVSAMSAVFGLSFVFPFGRALFSFTISSLRHMAIAGGIVFASYFVIDAGVLAFKKLFPHTASNK
ncbi:putative cation-transporting ATPase F [Andreesenia angusta]|uniref:Putative cation-transporting ATPase F n=1 Tax=Andreesenia angusta TaxID=39480 RepID=A0A1S1VAF0_9FIRM|nr:HAD-IC family P-type ATPase [Andreesenia angusta]OHW63474.1 putative cation-transporting ATPase F [Andreesenia angusta]